MNTVAEIRPGHEGRIVVETAYVNKDKVKAVAGARWDSTEKFWHVPLGWTSALALRAEFGEKLLLGPRLAAWGAAQAPVKKGLLASRNLLSDASIEVPDKPGFSDLYGYQIVGADLIRTARQYLITDSQGLGKTRAAIAGLSMLEADGEDIFPVAVVAPKSVLRAWESEIKLFFPKANISVVAGTAAKVRKALEPGADWYVMSYDSMRLNSRLLPFPTVKLSDKEKADGPIQALGIRSVIADEAHRAKSMPAKRTRALIKIGDDAEFRIALTGTPIQEHAGDLYAILRFLNSNEYPTKSGFERYLDVRFNQWGYREIVGVLPMHKDEFFANLDTRMRRITKDVALELPPKVFSVRWVTLPAAHRRLYDAVETRMISPTLDGEGVIAVDSVLTKATRLLAIANAAGHIDEDTGEFIMDAANSPKVDVMMEDIKAGDYEGEQVVIFSDSKKLLHIAADAMTKAGEDFVMVTGDTGVDERQDAVDLFQARNVQWFLMTRAMSEGVTLSNASTMIRLVRSFSLTTHSQVEDRVHRIGSEIHDSVRFVDMLTEDTLEEGQMSVLARKEKSAQGVLRDKDLLDMIMYRKT